MKTLLSHPLRLTALIIFSLLGFHLLLWLGGRYLEGYPSELCQKIQGFSVTPFFMEFGFIAFGFMAVMAVNYYRQKWEGDELVYLEVVDDPQASLPTHSRSAVFAQRHQADALETKIALVEGALLVEDYSEAQEQASHFTPEEREKQTVRVLLEQLRKA